MQEHAQAVNSVFFSTLVLEVAETVCDKIAVIDKARILYAGDLSEMKETADESLESIFLEMTNDEKTQSLFRNTLQSSFDSPKAKK